MKTVFKDASAVAHLWANKHQDHAKNAGHNFYFEGNEIYSYGSHFIIARHIVNENGDRAVLFTQRTYSNTTAKHIHITRQACRHLNVIYVPNPVNLYYQNFEAWQSKAESIAANLVRSTKPEKWLTALSHIANSVSIYSKFISQPVPDTLTAILSIENKAQYAKYADIKEKYLAEQKAIAQKKLAADHKKELAKWLKGETNRLYTHNGFDYLRMSGDRIETTQAAKIPASLGKKLWEKVKDNTLSVGDKVMSYEVNQVGAIIKIGCHTFKRAYLVKFGETSF